MSLSFNTSAAVHFSDTESRCKFDLVVKPCCYNKLLDTSLNVFVTLVLSSSDVVVEVRVREISYNRITCCINKHYRLTKNLFWLCAIKSSVVVSKNFNNAHVISISHYDA